MICSIASLAGYGANLLEAQGKHSAKEATRYALTREHRRDQINAENLKWLIDKAYAGRKIMVWAHNAHVMNAWYGRGFDSVSLEPLTDGMKPMGVWLSGFYGEALYKIGFTACQGSDGWVGAPPQPVPPGSIGRDYLEPGAALRRTLLYRYDEVRDPDLARVCCRPDVPNLRLDGLKSPDRVLALLRQTSSLSRFSGISRVVQSKRRYDFAVTLV